MPSILRTKTECLFRHGVYLELTILEFYEQVSVVLEDQRNFVFLFLDIEQFLTLYAVKLDHFIISEKPEIFRVSVLVCDFLIQAFEAQPEEFIAPLHDPLGKLFNSKDVLLLEVGGDESSVSDDLDYYVLLVDRGNLLLCGLIDFLDCMPVEHDGST